jgi:hypothetical protein
MNDERAPPQKGGGKGKHPNYAAMATTLEDLAQELGERARVESDKVLAAQGERLRQLAAAIRSDLAESG